MANPFVKASKTKAKLRLALMGASGSGKTFSALGIASAFGNIAVIDTEHGSASKYADKFTFDTLELSNYHPQNYINALKAAADAGYDVVIIDSLSHAWNGIGGVLEIVDKAAAKSDSKNTYTAWRDATPLQQQLVEAMLASPMHVIVTMRSKTEYVLELDKRGKMSPRKVGTAPVQRDGIEFEFDMIGEMNADNELVITKTRVSILNGETIPKPDKSLGESLLKWLSDGVEPPLPSQGATQAPPAQNVPSALVGAGNGTQGTQRPNLNSIPPIENGAQNSDGSDDEPLFAPNAYRVTEVKCNPQGSSHVYLLKSGATNIALYGGDLFRAIKIDPKFWQDNPGKWFEVKPALNVTADFDGKTWIVHSMAHEAEQDLQREGVGR